MVKISVSIPTFNRVELLKRCLASVFAQTVPPDEIIVIDDGSTDGTWEYLKSIRGIKAYRNKKNLGMIENWNETIRRAKSKFVVSLHSDDLLLPDYIKNWKEKMAYALQEEPQIAAFFSGGYIIDASDKVMGLVQPFRKDLFLKPANTLNVFWQNYRFYISVTGWTVYNKEIVKKVGYFTRNYEIAAENEMSLKILPHYPVYFSCEPHFAFRRHWLQGFEGKPKKFGLDQELKNLKNGFQVFLDYEKDTAINKSFSKKEQSKRIFVRKPIAYLVPQSFLSILRADFARAKAYLALFRKYYPKPYFDLTTAILIFSWSFKMLRDFLRNLIVVLSYKLFSFQRISIPR